MKLRAWLHRLRDFTRRRELRARLNEELSFHLDQLTAEHVRRGLAPAAAREAAGRDLGNATLTRESHREQAGLPWIEEIWRDIVLAARNLGRRPGYAFSMVGLLGIGLAATLTVYVLVHTMLGQALPVPRPQELHQLEDEEGRPQYVSRDTFERLQGLLPPGTVIGYAGNTSVFVQRGHRPAELQTGELVAGTAFSALGLQPAAGRLFTAADDTIGAGAAVAVVDHTWAVDQFGSAAAALGQEIAVNRVPVAIIGVLPASFAGLDVADRVRIYLPLALQSRLQVRGNARQTAFDDRENDADWNREPRVSWLNLLLRVPAGGRTADLLPALNRAYAPEVADMVAHLGSPQERERWQHVVWRIEPAPGGFSFRRKNFVGTAHMLSGLVVSLLLLTCANLSGIMLVRTLARHREMGVRLSLGAGRWRTCRLAIVEALVCGLAGAGIALTLTLWLVPMAARLLLPGAELRLDVLDWTPVGVLVGVAVLCSLACALAPAWWLSRLQPLVAMKGSLAGGALPQRVGRLLVAVQLALAVMLVAVAATLGREIASLLDRDPGFARETVLTTQFDPRVAGYAEGDLPALYERLRATARSVPGVEDVALAANGILAGSRSTSGIYARDAGGRDNHGSYQQEYTDVAYLRTVGMHLLQGRWFEASDRKDAANVAVVSRSLARKLWGTDDVVGKRFGYGFDADPEDMTVVGVVADASINRTRDATTEIFFVPAVQYGATLQYLAVRASRDPAAVQRMVADALAAAEPGLVFNGWKSLEQRREFNLRSDIASSRLATIIAALALVLATFGVGGSLAHLVALRQRELAVRVALGATPERLLRGVLADGLRLGAWGAAGGALLIVFVTWAVPRVGWWSATPGFWVGGLAAACGVLAALAGGWGPARRAARVDPQRVLKAD